jgi:uncharacterized membrane protein YsdA (DUF1294 family)/endonuclease YncB( thermonuclease family)
MPFLLVAAAAAFTCTAPTHHDGDNIRCGNRPESMRLHAIDAPEMPGSCRPGRDCTPGDPYAARDYLRSLTAGRPLQCEQLDTDNYGRPVVSCSLDGENIGCAMVAAGHAVERYGRLECGTQAAWQEAPDVADARTPVQPAAIAPPLAPHLGWALIPLWLLIINLATYAAFAIDKRRAVAGTRRRTMRIPESRLLVMAAIGGTPAAFAAQQRLRHKTSKQPFATQLLIIAGLQIGVLLGLAGLALF